MTEWFRVNKSSLNESKTKLFLFRSIDKLNLTVRNINLGEYLVTDLKFVADLGAEIDETLSWNNQIEVHTKNSSRTNETIDITFQQKLRLDMVLFFISDLILLLQQVQHLFFTGEWYYLQ